MLTATAADADCGDAVAMDAWEEERSRRKRRRNEEQPD